jgi:thiamine biosynthesis lipoprotein
MAFLGGRTTLKAPSEFDSLAIERPIVVESIRDSLLAVRFTAMASPCEVLLPTMPEGEARLIGATAAIEAWRIEAKFSRYRSGSVISWIHAHTDRPIEVDAETAALLDFARHCYEISDKRFDITSGILRRLWCFDGSDQIPSRSRVLDSLPSIGFDKLSWHAPWLTLPGGMELDFGGIGKEYAVDRACELIATSHPGPFLVNFGGDLRALDCPRNKPWQIGIERPGFENDAHMILELRSGGLATSGDSRRFLQRGASRYGHILDPLTGWPVADAPRSVTVAASSCTEAGLLATLAMLSGRLAEEFLQNQNAEFWIFRDSGELCAIG